MNRYVLLTSVSLFLGAATAALAQGTAFTYQGRLNDGASPASGSYDLRFSLHNALSDGSQLGAAVTTSATDVSNGLFIVTLDFGNQFPGASCWLEIAVRTNGGGAFDTLAPRQALTATPYAITANGVTGPINGGLITASSVTDAALSTNVALRSGGNIFGGSQTFNDVLTANGRYSGRGDIRLYAFDGNGSNGAAFLQARDSSGSSSIDLVLRSQLAGSLIDAVTIKSNGNVGIGGATPGKRLQVGGFSGTEGMIRLHSDSATTAAARTWDIGVPKDDAITSGKFYSFVIDDLGLGTEPEFMVKFGTGNVGIGTTNPAAKLDVNGNLNVAGSITGTSYVGDGAGLTLSTNVALRTGGNIFSSAQTFTGPVTVSSNFSGFGDFRLYAFQGNGNSGTAFLQARDSSGTSSIDLAIRSQLNGALVEAMRIKSNGAVTVSGNVGIGTALPGFPLSFASSIGDKIGLYGGPSNHFGFGIQPGVMQIHSDFSFNDITFGHGHSANMTETMRIKGNGLVGIGTNSPAATLHVRSVSTNTSAMQVETGSGDLALVVYQNGQVNVSGPFYALGNAEVWGEITTTAINLTSDRNAKEDFKPVNPREVLDKVARLPISEWQYKATDKRASDGSRHIGPMAQDFREAFALGRDDKHITSVDADGVALAAIQGLNAKLEERTREVESLKQSVAELRELVSRLTQPVNR